MSKTTNGVVFFKITNLEYDIVDTGQDSMSPDQYMAATMGELGCWVDTQSTKMVQTGVEHSRIPDVTAYLGIGKMKTLLVFLFGVTHLHNTVTYDVRPQLCDPNPVGPFTKIRDLVEAALYPSAMDYNLQLSLLLKGSRGCGKFTTTSWVAQSLGIHLLEVRTFMCTVLLDIHNLLPTDQLFRRHRRK